VPRWHVAAHGRVPCLLFWPKICTRGYPVFRVPTVAPQAHLGRGSEPAGEVNIFFPTRLFRNSILIIGVIVCLCHWTGVHI
jgi:hypothetical protein